MSEAGDSNPLTDPMGRDIGTNEVDAADNLMTGNDRVFDVGKFRIDDVKVGSADSARAYLDANFVAAWKRVITLLKPKKRSTRGEDHRPQIDSPPSTHAAVNATSGSVPSWIGACRA